MSRIIKIAVTHSLLAKTLQTSPENVSKTPSERVTAILIILLMTVHIQPVLGYYS